MKKILLWIRMLRPQTLPASLCPVAIGLLAVPLHAPCVAAITLLCALSLQILSNLINDYYDFVRGADQAGRAGFKRGLAEGEVSVGQLLVAIAIVLLVALGTGAFLVGQGGWPILLIGLSALIFAWLYTATRFSLSYLGIADLFVFTYYGVVASTGTAYLQTGHFSATAFFSGGVCGLLSMCVLMINNLRDIQSDAVVGKLTLPVRFGKTAGETMMLVCILLTPIFSFLAYGPNLSMLIVIPALYVFWRVLRAEGKAYNKCLAMMGLANIVYVLLVLCVPT